MASRFESETPPIDPTGFRSLLEKLNPPKRVLLAVSGGSDSMALMHLAAPLRDRGTEISVATVDHGLRAGSREEAEFVARAAEALGLDHEILVWTGEKPRAGIQTAARHARYRLLARHCAGKGFEALATAHTADDQAETVFMRLQRGSGLAGLSGMAADSLIAADAFRPVRLLRPLLGVRRANLRDYLKQTGAEFVDDPGNDDEKFERVRTRSALKQLEAGGLVTTSSLLETADVCRLAAASHFDQEDRRFAAASGRFDIWGAANLNADMITVADASLAARLIQAVAGAEHPPNAASAEAALSRALTEGAATLGGVMLLRRDGQIVLFREPAAVFGRDGVEALMPVELAPGAARIVWDKRFIVGNRTSDTLTIAPIGDKSTSITDADAVTIAVAPGAWRNGHLVAFPGEGGDFQALAEERFQRRIVRFH